jgi:hypothetical protein
VAISARPVSANVGELESEQPAIKASEAAIPKPTIFLLSKDINISPIRYYSKHTIWSKRFKLLKNFFSFSVSTQTGTKSSVWNEMVHYLEMDDEIP